MRESKSVDAEDPPAARRGGRMSSLWWWTILPSLVGGMVSVAATLAGERLGSSVATASAWTAIAIAIATVFGAQLAQRRFHRLLEMTLTDPVTQLSNRRCLQMRLREELRRARAQKGSLALLFLDLDQLKTINDVYGHLAGDAALCAVARAIRHSCRDSDLAVRFGGDEFVVLMTDTTSRQALALAERIREALRRHPLAGGAPTVSIGIADTSIVPSYRVDLFLRAADRALYAAKQKGRDHVMVAPAYDEVSDRRFSVATTVEPSRPHAAT